MSVNLSMDELRGKLEQMSTEEKGIALTLLAKVGVDLSKPKGELTGTGVAAFIFQNKIYAADSHKDVFINLTQLLIQKYPDKKEAIFSIQGRKKKYFSRSVSDFRHGYEKIRGTDIFVDTNENATQLNRRCQRLLQTFGFVSGLLTIIPK